jgi:hypothetical protein
MAIQGSCNGLLHAFAIDGSATPLLVTETGMSSSFLRIRLFVVRRRALRVASVCLLRLRLLGS